MEHKFQQQTRKHTKQHGESKPRPKKRIFQDKRNQGVKSTDCRPECRSVLDLACGNADVLCLSKTSFPVFFTARMAIFMCSVVEAEKTDQPYLVMHEVYHDLVAKTIQEDTAGKPRAGVRNVIPS